MSGSVNKQYCVREEKDVCVMQKGEINATATSWLGFVVRIPVPVAIFLMAGSRTEGGDVTDLTRERH